MPILVKNGKVYGDHSVTLTQAQYDALSTAEKNNGTVYYITDGTANYPTAATTRYDHTDSGLMATSVQAAIDELNEAVGSANINLTFGSNSSNISITTTENDDGVLFDGTGKGTVEFNTKGDFRAKNLDSNNYLTNQIQMRSDIADSSDMYNRISFFNTKNNIMANQFYADAASNKTEFWFYNNRPGIAKNANYHFMGTNSTTYVNRLYNLKFNSLTSEGTTIIANNIRLESYENFNWCTLDSKNQSGAEAGYLSLRSQWESGNTYNGLWLNNFTTDTDKTANNLYMRSSSASNYTNLTNYDTTGASINNLYLYRDSSYAQASLTNRNELASGATTATTANMVYLYRGASNVLELYNNNTSAFNMNFIKLNHYPSSNWNRILIQNEWNDKASSTAKIANWIQCSNAGVDSDFQFYNYHNNTNLANTFMMKSENNSGYLQLTNRDSSGNVKTAIYLNADGYISIRTNGVQKQLYFDSNGFLKGQ